MTRPQEKEYFRWLNHMNDIGLLDKESFTQKYDQYLSKISTGRVLAVIDPAWDFRSCVSDLRKAGKEERTYGSYPISLDETVKCAVNQDPGYMGGWGIGITKSCKDPVRAIQFIDWLCTDEAQILTHWGIEGQTYTIQDGKRVLLPEASKRLGVDDTFISETGIGLYTYPWPSYGV